MLLKSPVSQFACFCFTVAVVVAPLANQANAAESETHANKSLEAILAAQPAGAKERYAARHPVETMNFFEIRNGDTIIETLPGGGWYSRILHPLVGETGKLIGAHYPLSLFERFGWDEKRLKSVIDRNANWAKTIASEAVAKGGEIDTYTMTEMPDRLVGVADKILFIRSLHNLNRFGKQAGYLDASLAEAFRALKPGGIAGVVQHRAPESASDEWASGSKGYLKQSYVIAAFEAAGFKFLQASEINANPKDRPSGDDSVWRLPPTLRGSKKDSAKWREYKEIGESDRMTLKFVKPSE